MNPLDFSEALTVVESMTIEDVEAEFGVTPQVKAYLKGMTTVSRFDYDAFMRWSVAMRRARASRLPTTFAALYKRARDESGIVALEFALVLGGIAIPMIAGLTVLAPLLMTWLTNLNTQIDAAHSLITRLGGC